MNTIARVKELSQEYNVSLFQLSRMAGISHSALKTTEQRNGQLKVDTIERICSALGISMNDFFKKDAL